MNMNQYQDRALLTAIYPNKGFNPVYPALGLAGEAGEVAEHIKKSIRDDAGKITPERAEKLKKELGDVLWYIAVLAYEVGFDLESVAQANIEKLQARQANGNLQGSGSDR